MTRFLRVGVDHAWNTNRVDGITVDAVTAAQTVRDLGAEIREAKSPDFAQIIADWFPLCSVQTAMAHEATYPARKSEYTPRNPASSNLAEACPEMLNALVRYTMPFDMTGSPTITGVRDGPVQFVAEDADPVSGEQHLHGS